MLHQRLFSKKQSLLVLSKFVWSKTPLNNCTFSTITKMGMPLKEIVNTLQAYAPLSLAETWDNVGLLVDPMTNDNVRTILLTNDLTEDIVEEAKKVNAGLIISYHPNIFQGLKTVSSGSWKERIVIQCIKYGIGVFSPHTSWDCVEGGVNDWLASAFRFHEIQPIVERLENHRQGSGRLLSLIVPQTVLDVTSQIKKHIDVKHIRLALAKNKGLDSTIQTVALCAGSGGSVLKGAKADLYLTGEMSHHDVLDATQNGIHVILCEHSNSERGFLKVFQTHIQSKYLQNQVEVVISQLDKDPLVTF